ncbi:MAG: lysophospholipid acyltransferase family protein [Vicinamibacterales bacterium]|jgi:1-acyl-sn-glycerol-3-phosphate acyltransferase|nr:lysophospholipid acyltransferase family protein [Vicinamibacterales bacterium]
MRLPTLPPSAPPFGNALTRAIGRAVLGSLGWQVDGEIPDLRRCVAVLAPHTSNVDLPMALAVIFATGLKLNWLGKHTIFWPPLGWLLRWLGGIPVDRRAASGTVEQATAALRAADRMFLGIAPEGTRSRVGRWKTGFLRIARAAGVPVVPVALDYSRKTVSIWPAMALTDDVEADLARIQERYRAEMARHPAHYGQ